MKTHVVAIIVIVATGCATGCASVSRQQMDGRQLVHGGIPTVAELQEQLGLGESVESLRKRLGEQMDATLEVAMEMSLMDESFRLLDEYERLEEKQKKLDPVKDAEELAGIASTMEAVKQAAAEYWGFYMKPASRKTAINLAQKKLDRAERQARTTEDQIAKNGGLIQDIQERIVAERFRTNGPVMTKYSLFLLDGAGAGSITETRGDHLRAPSRFTPTGLDEWGKPLPPNWRMNGPGRYVFIPSGNEFSQPYPSLTIP